MDDYEETPGVYARTADGAAVLVHAYQDDSYALDHVVELFGRMLDCGFVVMSAFVSISTALPPTPAVDWAWPARGVMTRNRHLASIDSRRGAPVQSPVSSSLKRVARHS